MKISVRAIASVVALSACIAAGSPANAATYIFDFASPDHSASGTLTTLDLAPSTITGISGVADGQAITGLSSFAAADNLLDSVAPYFTFSGLSFLANGVDYNVYGAGGFAYLFTSLEYPGGSAPVTSDDLLRVNNVSLAEGVPEPATWAMILLGFGFVGGAIRSARRRQRFALSYA